MPPIRRSAYLLAATAFVAFVLTLLWKPALPLPFVGMRSDEVAATVGVWKSYSDDPVPPEVRQTLPSANILYRTYNNPSRGTLINFRLIGGTDRDALHDPRSCLVGGGWHIENDRTQPLPGTAIDARACDAVGQLDSSGYDIVYLYLVDGKIRNQVTQIRAEMLFSALLGRKNRPVYFLCALIPLAADPASRAANHQQLLQFIADMWKNLPPYLTHSNAA